MLKLALHKNRSEYLQKRYFFIAIQSDRSKVLCMLYFIVKTFTVESACFTGALCKVWDSGYLFWNGDPLNLSLLRSFYDLFEAFLCSPRIGAWLVCACGYTLILHKEALVLFSLVSSASNRKSLLRMILQELLLNSTVGSHTPCTCNGFAVSRHGHLTSLLLCDVCWKHKAVTACWGWEQQVGLSKMKQ